MPKYVIERGIAGIGSASAEELRAISLGSSGVLRELGRQAVAGRGLGRVTAAQGDVDEALERCAHAGCSGWPTGPAWRTCRPGPPGTAPGWASRAWASAAST